MNISFAKSDDATRSVIKLEIEKTDYAAPVEKSLRDIRRTANIPGFRKGMAPIGMIKRMYGKIALVEEVNKLVSGNLFNYIREEKLNILGEPLPSETEQKEINFDADERFEFAFDLALSPEIHIELNKKTKVPYYSMIIDDEMVNKQIGYYRSEFGSFKSVDDVEEKDLMKGTVVQLAGDLPKEEGIRTEEATIMPMYIKDEEEKAKFMGAALNSTVVFNPYKAYEGSEAEIAAFLNIDKERVAEANSDFSFEINEITRYTEAELDQTLFDKVLGEGAVASEEEFISTVRKTLTEQIAPQSDSKFQKDIRELLIKKADKFSFADDLLKRWLLTANEENTPESIEDEYPRIIDDLKYHLIREHLIVKHEIKIENEDVIASAKKVAKAQFAQYGINVVPDNLLENYMQDMLKKEDTLRSLSELALTDKFSAWVKEHVKVEYKDATADEFDKFFND
ncbi:MAG: trigger factor [Tannerellaceae bacterium]|jgi:trigger factor|nr:trigger factor [Tannerellaceae bacterium]